LTTTKELLLAFQTKFLLLAIITIPPEVALVKSCGEVLVVFLATILNLSLPVLTEVRERFLNLLETMVLVLASKVNCWSVPPVLLAMITFPLLRT